MHILPEHGPGAIARTARRVRSSLVSASAGRGALPDVEIRDLAIYERLGSAREGETELAPPGDIVDAGATLAVVS